MKAHHANLGKAIDAFGDCSKLRADHPVHALKALHAALGRQVASRSWADAAPGDGHRAVHASAAGGVDGQPGKPGVAKSAWAEIEAVADTIVAKSAEPISRAKAIVKVMEKRPDLVVKYYNQSDPSFDRAARR